MIACDQCGESCDCCEFVDGRHLCTTCQPEPECWCYLHPNGGWVHDPECPAHGKHWSEMTIPERLNLFGV
jgi:hypothetical protein